MSLRPILKAPRTPIADLNAHASVLPDMYRTTRKGTNNRNRALEGVAQLFNQTYTDPGIEPKNRRLTFKRKANNNINSTIFPIPKRTESNMNQSWGSNHYKITTDRDMYFRKINAHYNAKSKEINKKYASKTAPKMHNAERARIQKEKEKKENIINKYFDRLLELMKIRNKSLADSRKVFMQREKALQNEYRDAWNECLRVSTKEICAEAIPAHYNDLSVKLGKEYKEETAAIYEQFKNSVIPLRKTFTESMPA